MTYKDGWGVHVTCIYDEDTGSVTDIEVAVVRLAPTNEHVIGGALCARVEDFYVPVDCFEDVDDLPYGDTHDLRTRWFASEREAQKHATYTLRRWQHPQPWESFVAV